MWGREASPRWKRKQWQRGNAARAPKKRSICFLQMWNAMRPQLHATQSPWVSIQREEKGQSQSQTCWKLVGLRHIPQHSLAINSFIQIYSELMDLNFLTWHTVIDLLIHSLPWLLVSLLGLLNVMFLKSMKLSTLSSTADMRPTTCKEINMQQRTSCCWATARAQMKTLFGYL